MNVGVCVRVNVGVAVVAVVALVDAWYWLGTISELDVDVGRR